MSTEILHLPKLEQSIYCVLKDEKTLKKGAECTADKPCRFCIKHNKERLEEWYKKCLEYSYSYCYSELKNFNKLDRDATRKRLIKAYPWSHLGSSTKLKNAIEKKLTKIWTTAVDEMMVKCTDSFIPVITKYEKKISAKGIVRNKNCGQEALWNDEHFTKKTQSCSKIPLHEACREAMKNS
ncbi:hypothetical protein AAEX28_12425 [Lentisphaerota bacterium WC36G]|nr:hypothetical protein LJT99_15250 [Lentisphaerae bacterium WC36]